MVIIKNMHSEGKFAGIVFYNKSSQISVITNSSFTRSTIKLSSMRNLNYIVLLFKKLFDRDGCFSFGFFRERYHPRKDKKEEHQQINPEGQSGQTGIAAIRMHTA